MASYPSDYDSSGSVESLEFHDHEVNAPKLPHRDLNFPLPSGLTVTWKNGRCDGVVNLHVLGIGAGRVVLEGIDVLSGLLSPYVFKLQGWAWHHKSNGYEHWIVSEYMKKFSPQFFGSVKAEYTEHKKTQWERTHTISVSVVRKVDKRVKDFLLGLSQNYVAEETVHVMMSVVKSFFDTVYQLCVNVNLSLTDLGTGNVGVVNKDGQNCVVILDAETAKPMPQTDDKWQRLTKSKATKAVNLFFTDFDSQTRAASSEARWQILCSTIHDELYKSWFRELHAIPTPEEIEVKMFQCCKEVLMKLHGLRSTAMLPRTPSRSLSPPPEQRRISTGSTYAAATSSSLSPGESPPQVSTSPWIPVVVPPAFIPAEVVLTFFEPSTDSAKSKLEEICRKLGLEIPTYEKMMPGTRRRLPAKPPLSVKDDTYIPIRERHRAMISHPQHNIKKKPTEPIELTKDAHILLRCLHLQLPKGRVKVPTKITWSEDEFARRYGRKFATFAKLWKATCFEGDVMRMDTTRVRWILHWWLWEKLSDPAPFAWKDFTMSNSEIASVVSAACDDWIVRYSA